MRLSFLTPTSTDSGLNLGPLALIAPLLDKLDVAKIIDEFLPGDPRLEFSHGKVLSLLMAARLCEPNALANIAEWAEEHAADLLWGIPSEKLNDDRFARSLDAFFEKRHSIMTAVTLRAMDLAELSFNRLHFDTTHVTFTEAYERSVARILDGFDLSNPTRDFPSDIGLSPAHITKGYLDDRRMIQVGVTSHVDDLGAVPVFCHPVDGNRNGHTAIAEQFELLRKHLPLQEGMQLVSDRGTYSAEHVAKLRHFGFHFLGAVPWGDFQSMYDSHVSQLDWQQASFLSQEQQRRRQCDSTLPLEHYEIATVPHELRDPANSQPIPCRVIFCYSTAAEKEEAQRRAENIEKIRDGFERLSVKLAAGHPRTTQASAAKQIQKLLGKKDAARYFTHQLVPLTPLELASLPEPGKGFRKPTHRLEYTFDEAAAEAAKAYDGLSALLATAKPAECPDGKSSDQLFTEYKQQGYVEQGHHQFKAPIAVRPIFLKTPSRVEALIFLLTMAMQAYQMLERLYRQTIPATAPKKERLMTTERLLRAFDVYMITLRDEAIGQIVIPTRLRKKQRDILDRLGLPRPYDLLSKSLPSHV